MVAPAAWKQTDKTLSPSPGREHSSDCHKRHWRPFSTSMQLVWTGGSTALPEELCPKKYLPPSLVFLSTGFDERLLVSTIFQKEAFPGKFSPTYPSRKLCLYLVLGLQGCDSATLSGLWREGNKEASPALPVPLQCSHWVKYFPEQKCK